MKPATGLALALLISATFIGVGFYIAAPYLKSGDYDHATARVVDYNEGRVSRGSRRPRKTVYTPIYEFTTLKGTTHRFVSKLGDNDRPEIGSTTPVVYDPADPDTVLEDVPMLRYGMPGLMGGMGIIGVILILGAYGRAGDDRKRAQRLKVIGRPVQARLTGTKPTGLVVADNKQYIVTAQWYDDAAGTTRDFKSRAFWYDPAKLLDGRSEVTVYINPAKPKEYWVDLSFLPTKAT